MFSATSVFAGDVEDRGAPQDQDGEIQVPPAHMRMLNASQASLTSITENEVAVDGDDNQGSGATTLNSSSNNTALISTSRLSPRKVLANVIPGSKAKKVDPTQVEAVIIVPGLKRIDDSTSESTIPLYEAFVDQVIRFDGSSSTAPGGANIRQYQWDFGDGINYSDRRINTKKFDKAREQTVTLTVDGSHDAKIVLSIKEGGNCWQKLSSRCKKIVTLATIATLVAIAGGICGILFQQGILPIKKAAGETCHKNSQCESENCQSDNRCGCVDDSGPSDFYCSSKASFCYSSEFGDSSECKPKAEKFSTLFIEALPSEEGETFSVAAENCAKEIEDAKSCYNNNFQVCKDFPLRKLANKFQRELLDCIGLARNICSVVQEGGDCCEEDISAAAQCVGEQIFRNIGKQCELGHCSIDTDHTLHPPNNLITPGPTPDPTFELNSSRETLSIAFTGLESDTLDGVAIDRFKEAYTQYFQHFFEDGGIYDLITSVIFLEQSSIDDYILVVYEQEIKYRANPSKMYLSAEELYSYPFEKGRDKAFIGTLCEKECSILSTPELRIEFSPVCVAEAGGKSVQCGADVKAGRAHRCCAGLECDNDSKRCISDNTFIPTASPTPIPSKAPTARPTSSPLADPTPNPNPSPLADRTPNPTPSPSKYPTPGPTPSPSKTPTPYPTPIPTSRQSKDPTPTPLPIEPAVRTDKCKGKEFVLGVEFCRKRGGIERIKPCTWFYAKNVEEERRAQQRVKNHCKGNNKGSLECDSCKR